MSCYINYSLNLNKEFGGSSSYDSEQELLNLLKLTDFLAIPFKYYLILVINIFTLFGIAGADDKIPENSRPNISRTGWECIPGYRFSGSECEKVAVPANAHLSNLGHDWECNAGYRTTGIGCEKIVVPENAHLSFLGHSWECNRGYKSSGTECTLIQVPSNAHLSLLGHSWECDRGFRSNGESCELIIIPQNARLSSLGSSWECNDGFKNTGNACVLMTQADKDAERIHKQQLIDAYLAGRREYVVSGECDGESVTGNVTGYRLARALSGTLEYNSGQTVDFDGNWTGRGQINGTDEFGNSCDLEVE